MEKLLDAAVSLFNIYPKGVIHVGASSGQEGGLYELNGFKKILWIEADPTMAKFLREIIEYTGKKDWVQVENFAASDKNGDSILIKTNNQYSSSLLPLKKHSVLHPDVKAVEEINITLKKLDDYFLPNNDNYISQYNFLVLDIQGYELNALNGSHNVLESLDCIISEIQYDELYHNTHTVTELDDFLMKKSFIRVDTISYNRGWGNALYVKKDFLSI